MSSALDDLDSLGLATSVGADLSEFFARSPWPPESAHVVRAKFQPNPSHAILIPPSRTTGRDSLIVYTWCDDDDLIVESIEAA